MKPLRILVCDDSLLVRTRLKESLDQCGRFEVLEASDGQEAVDLYKEHRADVVFLDLVMPVRDGLEALKEIRAYDRGAYVIIVSSAGTQSNLKEALREGAADFIQKPWEDGHILSVMTKVIKERGGYDV